MAEPCAKIFSQIGGRRVPLRRRFRKTLEADRLEFGSDARIEPPWWFRVTMEDLHERLDQIRTRERRLAGQDKVQDRPEGVDVRSGPDLLTLGACSGAR